jgi:hypothetical protein
MDAIESHMNEPRSGGFAVSPERKPRDRLEKISEPRSGDTGCDTAPLAPELTVK